MRVEAASTVPWLAHLAKLPSLVSLPPRLKVPSGVKITVGQGGHTLQPMMWMFLAILVTFLVTRIVTRLIRSGSGAGAGLGNVKVGWQPRSSPGLRHPDHHRHGHRPGIGDPARCGA